MRYRGFKILDFGPEGIKGGTGLRWHATKGVVVLSAETFPEIKRRIDKKLKSDSDGYRNHGMKENPMRRKRNPRSTSTCKMCGGPKMILGSLGWTRHFRCRDCGAESSQQVRRPKPRKNNPTRRRASKRNHAKAYLTDRHWLIEMVRKDKSGRRRSVIYTGPKNGKPKGWRIVKEA